jgi:hypothetical protein
MNKKISKRQVAVFTEIPVDEVWLYQNRKALKSVKKGLKESAEGKLVSRGSFAQFVTDNKE